MTIRKKILYSNILMLIIPVLIIASLGMIGVKKVGSRYWESLERMYEDGSGAVSVRLPERRCRPATLVFRAFQIERKLSSPALILDLSSRSLEVVASVSSAGPSSSTVFCIVSRVVCMPSR